MKNYSAEAEAVGNKVCGRHLFFPNRSGSGGV